jgi:hypothetical protein
MHPFESLGADQKRKLGLKTAIWKLMKARMEKKEGAK